MGTLTKISGNKKFQSPRQLAVAAEKSKPTPPTSISPSTGRVLSFAAFLPADFDREFSASWNRIEESYAACGLPDLSEHSWATFDASYAPLIASMPALRERLAKPTAGLPHGSPEWRTFTAALAKLEKVAREIFEREVETTTI